MELQAANYINVSFVVNFWSHSPHPQRKGVQNECAKVPFQIPLYMKVISVWRCVEGGGGVLDMLLTTGPMAPTNHGTKLAVASSAHI